MKLEGNTILITGGGTGIGRALAEALHERGNTVIIAGRRRERLAAVVAANPGMAAVELDIADPASIEGAVARILAEHPALNVLINNAAVMYPDDASRPLDDALLASTVATNLIGPVRLTSALIEHLKTKNDAVVAYTTSVLGFVPLAVSSIYSSAKAALHAYILSQRFMLRDSGVRVLEIIPNWVRTELMGSQDAEAAMPLDQFITELMPVLGSDADEVFVESARPMRGNVGPGERAFFEVFNDQMLALYRAKA